MVFQQFGGINGIGFYASETFAEAGKQPGFSVFPLIWFFILTTFL